MKLKFKSFSGLLIICAFLIACGIALPSLLLKNNLSRSNNLLNPSYLQVDKLTSVLDNPIPPANLGATIYNEEFDNGIADYFLYSNLLEIYNSYYNLQGEDKEKLIKRNMFANFEVLDLSGSYSSIASIKGLRHLNLQNLKTLNLGKNKISQIDVLDINSLQNLEQLILFDNNLADFTLPSSLEKLQVLNLNKNYISRIDISTMREGGVYLGFNKFTSINDIKFPKLNYNTNLYVELFNNNIVDADEMYSAKSLGESGKIILELGFQGAGLNYKVTDDDSSKVVSSISRMKNIKFYNSDKYNLQVKIINNINNKLVETISNSAEQDITIYNFAVGEYRVEYISGITQEQMHENNNQYLCVFKNLDSFIVVPSAPTLKFIIKGKEYSALNKKIGANVKVIATSDEGEIYYSIANGDWQKGSEVKLTHGGEYLVSFKCVVAQSGTQEAYESEITSQLIKQSLNPNIPDVVMIVIIVIIVLLLYFGLLPLIKKYLIK